MAEPGRRRERGEPKSAGQRGRLTEKVTSPLFPRCGGSPLSPLRLSLCKKAARVFEGKGLPCIQRIPLLHDTQIADILVFPSSHFADVQIEEMRFYFRDISRSHQLFHRLLNRVFRCIGKMCQFMIGFPTNTPRIAIGENSAADHLGRTAQMLVCVHPIWVPARYSPSPGTRWACNEFGLSNMKMDSA